MRYLILLAVLILSGCGQKGALFLPHDKTQSAPVTQPQLDDDMSTTQGQPQGEETL